MRILFRGTWRFPDYSDKRQLFQIRQERWSQDPLANMEIWSGRWDSHSATARRTKHEGPNPSRGKSGEFVRQVF
jgi:hypothetical protein